MAEKEKYTNQPRSAEKSVEKSFDELFGPLPKKEYELAPKDYELPKKEYEKKKPEVNYPIKKAKPGHQVPKQQYT
jgi:hypothetical protein